MSTENPIPPKESQSASKDNQYGFDDEIFDSVVFVLNNSLYLSEDDLDHVLQCLRREIDAGENDVQRGISRVIRDLEAHKNQGARGERGEGRKE
jgi:hypothetical protein